MAMSGAKRRRTSKAEQLQKSYANNEDFLVAIEDFQVAQCNQIETAKISVKKFLLKYCFDYVGLYAKDNTHSLFNEGRDLFDKWTDHALDEISDLNFDEVDIQTQIIHNVFNIIFQKQFRKSGTSQSEITFYDDTLRTVTLTISDQEWNLNQPIRLNSRVFFIESPKIYDYLSNTNYGHVQKEYLRYLMAPNVFKRGMYFSKTAADEYSPISSTSPNSLQMILGNLESVMGGKAEFLQKIGLEFKDKYIEDPIHAVNVSTGLKSLALLEYALRIGAIESGDILILDEPEINLHPEWQVEYAKALVELQKSFQLKILITSHSPYFMRAIECFADIHDSMDNLNVYRMIRSNDRSETVVENLSYSEYGMTDLYDQLSAPLETLDNLLEDKYGKEDDSD